jgi:cyclohexa-1,5-dienecarbonyl-CoA hydratase
MDGNNLTYEEREEAGWISINRPPLNIINIETARELGELLEKIKSNRRLRFLVLSSAGERAFSAGVDIRDHLPDRVQEMLVTVHRVFRILTTLPQVTISRVRGLALGGGCELATFCDLVVAAESSTFATPELDVGCYPPVALAEFPSQIGFHRAADLILTSRKLTAREAWEMGLVSRLVRDDDLDREIEGLLRTLREKSPSVLKITLETLRSVARESFDKSLRVSETAYRTRLLKTEDVREGVVSFLEKRKPNWSGR